MSKKYLILFTLTVFYHPAMAAFENFVLQSYLHPSDVTETRQPYLFCGSLNFPSFTYLNQYELGFQIPVGETKFGGTLYTSGDRLYRESMARFYAAWGQISALNYSLKLSVYHVRVEGYGSSSVASAGLVSRLKPFDDIILTLDYDNLVFFSSSAIREDIPRRGLVTIESRPVENQTVIYRLEKEIPHPINHQIYWKSALRPTLHVLGGFTSAPRSFILGGQIEKRRVHISVGMIYHPILITSVSVRLTYLL